MNPAIEIHFPDIRLWSGGRAGIAGAAALPYVWTYQAGTPGPHVCVNALVHGNEVCGAIAADWLMRELAQGLRPARGSLSVVFANVDAYHRFDAAQPFASRCIDEDFNRLWDVATLDGTRDSIELRRARQLRPFYDTVDHLLDLHSMLEPAPPIALAGDTVKGLALAQALGMPEHILVDSGHAAGKRLRDYVDFGDPLHVRSALLVECGQHWEVAAGDVAKQSTLAFLRHFDMLDATASARLAATSGAAVHASATASATPQKVIDITTVVTVRHADFRWLRALKGLEVIARADTPLAVNGDETVRTPHDNAVMVMPVPQPKVGQTAVRIGRFRPVFNRAEGAA